MEVFNITLESMSNIIFPTTHYITGLLVKLLNNDYYARVICTSYSLHVK